MITPEEVKAKTPELYWNKIKFGEANECWEWQSKTTQGYGIWQTSSAPKTRKQYAAHRYMYEFVIGNFNPVLNVCHSCDNPKCCNPNHLWLGTQKDNVQDRNSKGRQNILRGSKLSFAKLNEEKVIAIRKRLAAGEKQYVIAKDYGVSRTAINEIHRGVHWWYV